MNISFKLLAVSALFTLCAACTSEPVFVKATELCRPEYKQEMVITEGVIRLPSSFYTTGGTATLILENSTRIRLPALKIKTFGDKKNTMEQLKDNYAEEDVKIYDNNGNTIKLGDKVRVTGKLYGASNDWCEISVEKIEKVK